MPPIHTNQQQQARCLDSLSRVRVLMLAVLLLGIASFAAQVSTAHAGVKSLERFSAVQQVSATTNWSALDARADSKGSVRVVATLDAGQAASTKSEELAHLTQARDELISEFGGASKMRRLNAIPGSPIVAFTADRKDLARLRKSSVVSNVVVDGVHDSAGTSSNGAQNGVQLKNGWDYFQIGADWANGNGYTGSGQSVVVIDTGVDRSHPWLSGRVKTEACFATNTNGTGACPNGLTYDYNATSTGVTGAAANCTYTSCAATARTSPRPRPGLTGSPAERPSSRSRRRTTNGAPSRTRTSRCSATAT